MRERVRRTGGSEAEEVQRYGLGVGGRDREKRQEGRTKKGRAGRGGEGQRPGKIAEQFRARLSISAFISLLTPKMSVSMIF